MTTFSPHTQLNAAALNAAIPYNVLSPTGGDDTAMLSTAFAASATRAVYLNPGQYLVASPLTIPAQGMVLGSDIHVFEFYDGFTQYLPNTYLSPTSPASWTSGTAVVNFGAHALARGFSVYGSYNGTIGTAHGINGFDFSNSPMCVLDWCQALRCDNGFLATPNSVDCIGPWLSNCSAGINETYGIVLSGGSHFVSDFRITNCWTQANAQTASGAGECAISAGAGVIIGSRFEDGGGYGLQISSGSNVVVTGNYFDLNSLGSVRLHSCDYVVITGNRFASHSGAVQEILFDGFVRQTRVSGNSWEDSSANAIFKAIGGSTLTGVHIDALPMIAQAALGVPLFADFTSESLLGKTMISRGSKLDENNYLTITPSSNTFTPDIVAARNFSVTLTHGVTNTIAAFAGSSFVESGTIQIIASSTGSDVIAWDSSFGNIPSSLNGTTSLAVSSKNYVDFKLTPSGNAILSNPILNTLA
jgi:hypothetical protein